VTARCEVHDKYRVVCAREPFFREYDGKKYCALHYPDSEKTEEFERAFKQKLYDNDFDFRCVWFPGPRSFYAVDFNKPADFTEAYFAGPVNFDNVVFETSASFWKAKFTTYASFRNSRFNDDADFDDSEFIGASNFSETTFSGKCTFRRTTFFKSAYFEKTHFKTDALFLDTKFRSRGLFTATEFEKTHFGGAHFADYGIFEEAVFNDYTGFTFAKFERAATFDKATINNGIDFLKAHFSSDARFDLLRLNSFAGFHGAVFGGPVSFFFVNTIHPHASIAFDGAIFYSSFRVRNCEFVGGDSMSLDAVLFEKPDRVVFLTSKLHPFYFLNIDPRKFNFIDVKWSKLNRLRDIRKQIRHLPADTNSTSVLEVTFQQLAMNSEENNRYEEASNFRYLAMELRRFNKGRFRSFFSLHWWYWAMSGYGERVLRAAVVFLLIWAAFGGIYSVASTSWWGTPDMMEIERQTMTTETEQKHVGNSLSFADALIYSFGVMTLQKPEPKPANKRAKTLILLETILGPFQAALLALAIRRKFMR
jgi:uncharacterized protein YjbI with pentapeptide repeats